MKSFATHMQPCVYCIKYKNILCVINLSFFQFIFINLINSPVINIFIFLYNPFLHNLHTQMYEHNVNYFLNINF